MATLGAALFTAYKNQEGVKQFWSRRIGTAEKAPLLSIEYTTIHYLLNESKWEEYVTSAHENESDPNIFTKTIFDILLEHLEAQRIKVTLTTYPSDDQVDTVSKMFTAKKSKKRKNIDEYDD